MRRWQHQSLWCVLPQSWTDHSRRRGRYAALLCSCAADLRCSTSSMLRAWFHGPRHHDGAVGLRSLGSLQQRDAQPRPPTGFARAHFGGLHIDERCQSRNQHVCEAPFVWGGRSCCTQRGRRTDSPPEVDRDSGLHYGSRHNLLCCFAPFEAIRIRSCRQILVAGR